VPKLADEFGPRLIDAFNAANAKLDDARAAFDRGDALAARSALRVGVAAGRDLDRRGTGLAKIVGEKIVGRGLDLVDAHRAQLDAVARFEILANASLDRSTKPFEAERIHGQWRLAHPSAVPGTSAPSERALADEMAADDLIFREMQRAVLEGDVPGCERAAGALGPLARRGRHVFMCAKLGDARQVRERLDASVAEFVP